mgnify:FL=1
MAKRFTDTNKYKKPFIRGLQGPYKLLWDYLYHDCDHAGIWIVDFEITQLYLGADMPVNKTDALRFFNEGEARVIEFDQGKKWFIISFIQFQYGELNEQNRVHASILSELNKSGINKGLIRSLQRPMDKEEDKDKDKEGECEGKNSIDYQFVIDNYHTLCPKMSKVQALNKTRKGYINARVGEYGLEKVISVLRMAGQSDFLNGINDKAWKADFEWIVRPENFVKVMEGKYVNKKPVPEKAELALRGKH